MAFRDDNSRFLLLLASISRQAKSEHVKTLKFVMMEKLTKRELESCEDMMDIFEKMMNRLIISSEKDSLHVFRNLIIDDIFRGDREVIKLFDDYENYPQYEEPCVTIDESISRMDCSLSSEHNFTSLERLGRKPGDNTERQSAKNDRFERAFKYASQHLGHDWEIFARLMGLGQSEIISIKELHKGKTEEQCYETFSAWYSRQTFASMTEFRKVLRAIPRNDIADELKKY